MENSPAQPLTLASLAEDFARIGIRKGEILLVHSSLKSLGWVCGGAECVVRALLAALGPEGTLVMPTHTRSNTEPSRWQNPPVPESWWPIIRAQMPPFSPLTTPTEFMGAIPETFRRFPEALRSAHPVGSFTALGKRAPEIVSRHALESIFGEESPLAALYRLGGRCLLLGVGYDSCTSLHLAESRARWPSRTTLEEGSAILENGRRVWKKYTMPAWDTDDFSAIGEAYEQHKNCRPTRVGDAPCRLLLIPELVDFAVSWMEKNRS